MHYSINGSFSIRQGACKLALCLGSGGWSEPKPGSLAARTLPPAQLYDLATDLAEQHNTAAGNPEVVERLTRLLEKNIADVRSTPGPPQKNAAPSSFGKAAPPHPVRIDAPRKHSPPLRSHFQLHETAQRAAR